MSVPLSVATADHHERVALRAVGAAPAVIIASLMREHGSTGLQTHVRAVRAVLGATGRDCTLVTPFDAPLWQIAPVFGTGKLMRPVWPAANVAWHDHWHVYYLARLLRQRLADGRPCILYAQCPPSARAALAARKNTRQRVVLVVHFNVSQADEWVGKGMIKREGSMYRSIRKREDEVLTRVDGLVFVSDYMRRQVALRHGGLGHVRHAVIPNFVADPGPFTVVAAQRGEAMQGDLITIGTLEPRKNQQYLLHILGAARQRGVVLRATLVGDGPDRAALVALAQTLGVTDLVQFAGFVPDAGKMIARHRAYVHVAQLESLPLVLIEALSHGVPVFAPAVGGIPEVFDDGVEGRMLPQDDPGRAAEYLISWLQSPPQMEKAAQAARRRFLRDFESAAAGARLATFLDNCAAG
jgi:glycosyltransferase involved in cell wall biosynthesis